MINTKLSLREKIYQHIRDNITYGKLMPGERLIEAKLTEEFQTSRSPIREALRQLESEGLITFERNKGITVSKLSIKQVEEIYSLRWLLESYAARLCAESAFKSQVIQMKKFQEGLKKAAENSDLIQWLHWNALFHNLLIQNSGNSNLIQVLDTLKRRVYRYHYMTIRVPGHFETYLDQHKGILKACEANDGDMAERYMKQHLEMIQGVLIGHLKNSLPFEIG